MTSQGTRPPRPAQQPVKGLFGRAARRAGLCLSVLGLIVLAGCSSKVAPTTLIPLAHADFDHQTLALTWQPGFCTVGKGCAPDQPRMPLIGLHGLWASEPHSLEARNIPVEQWWRDGCSLLAPEASPPVLDQAMQSTLTQIMPHTEPSLIDHEWIKHGACFGYQPGPFFAEASALRLRFARSPVAQFLAARAGTLVRHEDILTFFQTATRTDLPKALQLRCETDHEGRVALTQLWFTLRPDARQSFPDAGSYMSPPQNQDNCPASFWLKRW